MSDNKSKWQRKREALRAEWSGHIHDYKARGLNKAAFCRERGLSIWKLHYWLKVLQKESHGADGFVELSTDSVTPESGVWLAHGNLRVHVASGFDDEVLRRVIGVLS